MRLIDAKEMEKTIKEAFKENPFLMGMLLRWVRKFPTIDAVPVCRCKDCKHYHKDTLTCQNDGCGADHPNWYGNDFCSYGERKDGDGNV